MARHSPPFGADGSMADSDAGPTSETPTSSPGELDIVITRMRRRHLRSVLRIENESVHTSWSIGLFMNELALRTTRLYAVAKHGHEVVGFAGMLFSGPDAHVTTVSTDPAYFRCKVATRLLLVLSRAAIDRGAQNLTLEVRSSNEPAIALYRAFGLAPVGVRKNYYADLREDALVMWAHEIDQADHAERLAAIEATVNGRTHVERLDW